MLETETGEFDLRLIDFGLSKTTQDVQAKTNVQGRTVVGTPGYMSPDQASGLEYDARSEIYSLGCIMYESLAGQPPFSGESSLEVLNKHMRSDVLPLQELAPDVSPELCAIIEKCLSKNPEERFQTATEVSEALANFERGLFVESTERSSGSNDYRIEIPTQSFGVELPKDGKTANSNFGKILVGTSLVAQSV
jgi:serine/threonine-protein kinase